MRPLFNVPGSGSFAFAMGIISGYPVGAKVIVDLKQKGLCTKTEGERLLTFCNNSGPLFILGAVAVGMFHQPAIGSILFIAHFLGSLTVGLCFRFYKSGKNKTKTYKRKQSLSLFLKRVIKQLKMVRENDGRSFGELFGDAIKNSVNLLLKIGGFIVFFSVLINLLKYLKIIQILSQLLSIFLVPLGIEEVLLPAIASGLFEITTGIKMISTHLALPFIQKLMVTSFILGWAGLSIHSQVMSIITKMNISIGPYILGKGLHGIFSAIYTYLLLYYTPLSTTVLSQYNKSFTKVTNQNILESLYLSIIYLGNLLFFLVMFCIFVVLTTTFNKNKH
jgi:sporulation integral membrane protein YlbJ